jgi:fatty-acyl-CoA synthase
MAEFFFLQNRDKLTTSYICAPCETPLVGYTVGQLLQRSTDLYADREAVVFIHQNIRKTFQQLLEEVKMHSHIFFP